MTNEMERLYRESLAADEAFQAAVIRQFGRKNAGDMRYRRTLHNPTTRAAGDLYAEAIARFLDAKAAA